MLTNTNPDWGKSKLIKWKLFGKNKSKKQEKKTEIKNPITEDEEPVEKNEDIFPDETEHIEIQEIKEYHETLYTYDHPSFKKNQMQSGKGWESTSTIEKNVDEIDKKRNIYKQTTSGSDRLEKKVDQLLRNKGITSSKKKK